MVTPPAVVASGDPFVTDTLSINDRPVTLRRHVLAFFQSNRYLLHDLITHVINAIAPGSSVVDLYAGVGAFSIAAAVARGARVTAVEGDLVAAADLNRNAAAAGGGIEAVHQDVETFTARSRPNPDVLIVDPPRTGMSKAALEGALRLRARHLIYVSCDVATLARDSRKILDAGYTLQRIDAFDLFPHTPHVETVVGFENGRTVRNRDAIAGLRIGRPTVPVARGGLEEALEQRTEFAGTPEVFRMPLDAKAEACRRILDGFDDAIGRGRRHPEAIRPRA